MAITDINKKTIETCAIERDLIRTALENHRNKVQDDRSSFARMQYENPSESMRARIVACDATLANLESLLQTFNI